MLSTCLGVSASSSPTSLLRSWGQYSWGVWGHCCTVSASCPSVLSRLFQPGFVPLLLFRWLLNWIESNSLVYEPPFWPDWVRLGSNVSFFVANIGGTCRWWWWGWINNARQIDWRGGSFTGGCHSPMWPLQEWAWFIMSLCASGRAVHLSVHPPCPRFFLTEMNSNECTEEMAPGFVGTPPASQGPTEQVEGKVGKIKW